MTDHAKRSILWNPNTGALITAVAIITGAWIGLGNRINKVDAIVRSIPIWQIVYSHGETTGATPGFEGGVEILAEAVKEGYPVKIVHRRNEQSVGTFFPDEVYADDNVRGDDGRTIGTVVTVAAHQPFAFNRHGPTAYDFQRTRSTYAFTLNTRGKEIAQSFGDNNDGTTRTYSRAASWYIQAPRSWLEEQKE